MDTNLAFNILTLLTTSLGILIGFLLIFMQFIPERKRRIVDIYREKLLDITLENSDKSQVTNEEKIVNAKFEEIKDHEIVIKFFGKEYSLITLNLIVFTYTIMLFVFSLFCLFLIIFENKVYCDNFIYSILVLTIIAYLLLIPITIWSCINDFELKKLK